MFTKYLCQGCGLVWRSNKIIVICPVCRSKAVKVKNGVDTKEKLLSTKHKEVKNRLINEEGTYKNKFYRELDY
ncbi:hypothetical protein ES705_45148 [subsurface metagenome]